MDGWINVDKSISGHIRADLTCDALEIDQHFKAGTVDEIYAGHLFEHLTRPEQIKALHVWRKVLKPDGILAIVTPDFNVIAKMYARGDIDNEQLNSEFIYSYVQESLHRWCWDTNSLTDFLLKNGFRDAKTLEPDDNRLSFNNIPWQSGVEVRK